MSPNNVARCYRDSDLISQSGAFKFVRIPSWAKRVRLAHSEINAVYRYFKYASCAAGCSFSPLNLQISSQHVIGERSEIDSCAHDKMRETGTYQLTTCRLAILSRTTQDHFRNVFSSAPITALLTCSVGYTFKKKSAHGK